MIFSVSIEDTSVGLEVCRRCVWFFVHWLYVAFSVFAESTNDAIKFEGADVITFNY